jgi:hypothetical protein
MPGTVVAFAGSERHRLEARRAQTAARYADGPGDPDQRAAIATGRVSLTLNLERAMPDASPAMRAHVARRLLDRCRRAIIDERAERSV